MFVVHIERENVIGTLYVRIDAWIFWPKKNENRTRCREPTLARRRPPPDRVGRDEQGEARRANTTQNGGPHLELGRLRLKTKSKSDFSIAETWPTYLCTYLYAPVQQAAHDEPQYLRIRITASACST